jgi:hypothetical protein
MRNAGTAISVARSLSGKSTICGCSVATKWHQKSIMARAGQNRVNAVEL